METKQDLDAFVQEVAKYFVVDGITTNLSYLRTIHTCFVDRHDPQKGLLFELLGNRLRVSGIYPRNSKGKLCLGSTGRCHIEISANKHADVVAGEITRRLLPRYIPQYEREKRITDGCNASFQILAGILGVELIHSELLFRQESSSRDYVTVRTSIVEADPLTIGIQIDMGVDLAAAKSVLRAYVENQRIKADDLARQSPAFLPGTQSDESR